MWFFNTILDIVFPAKCISCGKNGESFCIKCLSDSPPAERESAKWVFSIYDYRHPPIKKALWLLKYKGKKRLAKSFAEVIYDKILEELSDLSLLENFNNIILIPIPLSKKRLKERGYNQAELICKELIRLSKTNHLTPPPAPLSILEWRGAGGEVFTLENDILIKTKETKRQAHIENRKKRLENILGSFSVNNEKQNAKLKNKNIILIDDITTTGATLNEARKILKNAGVRKVIAFTVAH